MSRSYTIRIAALLFASVGLFACARDLSTEAQAIGPIVRVRVVQDADRTLTSVQLPLGATSRFLLAEYGVKDSIFGGGQWVVRNPSVAARVESQPTDLGLTLKATSAGDTYIIGVLSVGGIELTDSLRLRVVAP